MRPNYATRGPLTVFLVLLTGYFVLAAADEPGQAAIAPADFRFERRDGSTVEGKLTIRVRLQTDFGFQEIEPKHLHRITFRSPDGTGNDVIELIDKSHARGRIDPKTVLLPATDGAPALTAGDLREIRASSKKSTSLWAILLGLLTLTAMEIVLGIDNVIFLAIVAGRLPEHQQPRARKLGLAAALGTRLLLLATLSFLLGLTKPLFTLPELPILRDLESREVSLRDLILFTGGLFLIGKSVMEVHEKLEAAKRPADAKPEGAARFGMVLVQIAILDIIFSLDSVITAIGMVDEVWVMMVAMVLAMFVMLAFSGTISAYVTRHPTLKILALSFLILIGVMLVAEALGQHIDKGYIYFAMAFAVVVEMINLRLRKKHEPDQSADSRSKSKN
jgi:predicted tellurium resistance membrane protein TerC